MRLALAAALACTLASPALAHRPPPSNPLSYMSCYAAARYQDAYFLKAYKLLSPYPLAIASLQPGAPSEALYRTLTNAMKTMANFDMDVQEHYANRTQVAAEIRHCTHSG